MKNRKERQYYENSNDNAAFLRCVDLLAGLIEKYADVVLEKIERYRCDYIVVKDVIVNLIEITPRSDVIKKLKAFAKHSKCNRNKKHNEQDKAA